MHRQHGNIFSRCHPLVALDNIVIVHGGRLVLQTSRQLGGEYLGGGFKVQTRHCFTRLKATPSTVHVADKQMAV